MAVVVNEMEVVPAPDPAPSSAAPRAAPEGKPIDPREVERALLKETERRSRVRAH